MSTKIIDIIPIITNFKSFFNEKIAKCNREFIYNWDEIRYLIKKMIFDQLNDYDRNCLKNNINNDSPIYDECITISDEGKNIIDQNCNIQRLMKLINTNRYNNVFNLNDEEQREIFLRIIIGIMFETQYGKRDFYFKSAIQKLINNKINYDIDDPYCINLSNFVKYYTENPDEIRLIYNYYLDFI